MGQALEEDFGALLRGQAVPEGPVDLTVPGQEHYVPVTKETVCYIVCGLLFNEHGEVLMMQEAKSSCYGTWYLPAGRMETNETITEAVKREVLEETGVEFEPQTLLCVEACSGFWYRFTLTGPITGGTLKDSDHRDKESIQARWASPQFIKSGKKGFPIRCTDIFRIIDIGVSHREAAEKCPPLLPLTTPHTKLLLRLVIIHMTHSGETTFLGSKLPHPHFPMGVISAEDQKIQFPIWRILLLIFGSDTMPDIHIICHGVLSLEYAGKPSGVNDGICLTLLLQLKSKSDKNIVVKDQTKFEWIPLANSEILTEVKHRLENKLFVPLIH